MPKSLSLLGAGGAGAAGFLPSDVSGLKVWCEADYQTFQDSARTTAATANNDPVGAWSDRSGNSNHLIQVTALNKPTLKTNEQNGLSGILYNAALQNNLYLAGYKTIIGTSGFSIYTVIETPSGGYTTSFDANYDASPTTRFCSLFMPLQFYGAYDAANTYVTAYASSTRLVASMFAGGLSTSSVDFYSNTTALSTGGSTGSNTNEATLNVGLNASTGGNNFGSYYFAFLAYAGKHGSTDRENIVSYLRTKWGV